MRSEIRNLRVDRIAIHIVIASALLITRSVCTFASAQKADTYAILVSGISKDATDRAANDRALSALRECLVKHARIDPRRLIVLTADTQESPPASVLQSTASHVMASLDKIASIIRPEDRFIFHYIGQANAVAGPSGSELRFNLPGPDVTQSDLAARISRIKANAQLIVLDCPCAALAAKALAADERVILCASTAEQTYGTQFTSHFVHALANPQTDTNADGRVCVLEAFTAAARDIEQWYRRMKILPTETPCLEDDGDGVPGEQPWKHATEGGDGTKAAAFFLSMVERSSATKHVTPTTAGVRERHEGYCIPDVARVSRPCSVSDEQGQDGLATQGRDALATGRLCAGMTWPVVVLCPSQSGGWQRQGRRLCAGLADGGWARRHRQAPKTALAAATRSLPRHFGPDGVVGCVSRTAQPLYLIMSLVRGRGEMVRSTRPTSD